MKKILWEHRYNSVVVLVVSILLTIPIVFSISSTAERVTNSIVYIGVIWLICQYITIKLVLIFLKYSVILLFSSAGLTAMMPILDNTSIYKISEFNMDNVMFWVSIVVYAIIESHFFLSLILETNQFKYFPKYKQLITVNIIAIFCQLSLIGSVYIVQGTLTIFSLVYIKHIYMTKMCEGANY